MIEGKIAGISAYEKIYGKNEKEVKI
jgi:hypothetical protein